MHIEHDDIFLGNSQANIKGGTGYGCGSRAIYDQLDLIEGLSYDFQGVEQGCTGYDGGSMLVIVHNWDFHLTSQIPFYSKAFGCFYVLQIYPAKCRFKCLYDIDKLFWLVCI